MASRRMRHDGFKSPSRFGEPRSLGLLRQFLVDEDDGLYASWKMYDESVTRFWSTMTVRVEEGKAGAVASFDTAVDAAVNDFVGYGIPRNWDYCSSSSGCFELQAELHASNKGNGKTEISYDCLVMID
jgi:hypothetical protein